MWNLALVASLALGVSSPRYDYRRYSLHELVALSDHVVLGTIDSVGETHFDLRVERDFLDSVESPRLHLVKFVNWTCAGRWAEYAVGQRVLLFVRGESAMGAGNEGDWAVIDGKAMVPYRVRGVTRVTTKVGDGSAWGSPVAIDEVGEAVRDYRAVFRPSLEMEGAWPRLRLELAVEREAAAAYAKISNFADQLYEASISSKAFVTYDRPPVRPSLVVEPSVRALSNELCDLTRSGGECKYGCNVASHVASIGDLDGDGWDELMIRGDHKQSWILTLAENGELRSASALSSGDLGMDADENYVQIAPLGDLNGDGIPDLGVTTFYRGLKQSRLLGVFLDARAKPMGTVVLPIGASDSRPRGSESLAGPVALVTDHLDAAAMNVVFGITVTTMEEVLPGFEREQEHSSVRWISRGKDGSSVATNRLDSASFIGDEVDVTFAATLVQLGDLDGDGLSEVALGHPFDDDGGEYRGSVWIVFFDRDGSVRTKTKISDWFGGFDAAMVDKDYFGEHLAAPGDIDGDGVPDLLVGGQTELWLIFLEPNGEVREAHAFGARSGGLVDVGDMRSLAMRRGPNGERQIVVSGTLPGAKPEPALWVLELRSDGSLAGAR